MSKHTKGPWTMTANFHQNGDIVVSDQAKEHEGTSIARIANFNYWDEAEANAHLIAAAPEMYDLLELLEFEGSLHKRHLEMVRYVLDKAKGKS
jgi:hypothetical protein